MIEQMIEPQRSKGTLEKPIVQHLPIFFSNNNPLNAVIARVENMQTALTIDF